MLTHSTPTPMIRLLVAALALPLLAACADTTPDGPVATTAVVADADAPLDFTGTPLPITGTDSTVTWIGAKLTGNHLGGFRDVSGQIYVDGDRVTGADVRIATPSIYSDNDRLTGHLQSDDFFSVETYPDARFQTTDLRPVAASDSLGADAEATHIVTGRLTMRGQTREVTFPAVVGYDGQRASVRAAFLINRTDWGITYAGMRDDLINERVRIQLNAVAEGGAAAATPAPADA